MLLCNGLSADLFPRRFPLNPFPSDLGTSEQKLRLHLARLGKSHSISSASGLNRSRSARRPSRDSNTARDGAPEKAGTRRRNQLLPMLVSSGVPALSNSPHLQCQAARRPPVMFVLAGREEGVEPNGEPKPLRRSEPNCFARSPRKAWWRTAASAAPEVPVDLVVSTVSNMMPLWIGCDRAFEGGWTLVSPLKPPGG